MRRPDETGGIAAGGVRLVVGVDGSPESVAALRWAQQAAAPSGGEVEAVFVVLSGGVGDADPAAVDAAADALAMTVRRAVGAQAAATLTSTVVLAASAAAGLAAASSDAAALVVGLRHDDDRSAGSSRAALLGAAGCPLVFVPARTVDEGMGPSVSSEPAGP